MLAQEEKLSSIDTLVFSLSSNKEALTFKAMLEIMSSLRHLTIHDLAVISLGRTTAIGSKD
jgi:hypothetical protein